MIELKLTTIIDEYIIENYDDVQEWTEKTCRDWAIKCISVFSFWKVNTDLTGEL